MLCHVQQIVLSASGTRRAWGWTLKKDLGPIKTWKGLQVGPGPSVLKIGSLEWPLVWLDGEPPLINLMGSAEGAGAHQVGMNMRDLEVLLGYFS